MNSFANGLMKLGVLGYVASLALPVRWDFPLLALVALSLPAVILEKVPRESPRQVTWPVAVFFLATVVSVLLSEDRGRSVRLTAPLLPAGLLYLLIAEHFDGIRAVRHLFISLSAVGLALGCKVLWTLWSHGGLLGPMSAVGLPLLVEDNDTALLAVLAPLSLALIVTETGFALRTLAGLSIIAGVLAACLVMSRTGTVAMLIALTCASTLLLPRRRLAAASLCSVGLVSVVLATDYLHGSRLVGKFISASQSDDGILSGRLALWSAAWAMFMDAPFAGHGPHTFATLYQTYLQRLHLAVPAVDVPWAHNLYLEMLAEQGAFGLAALSLMLFGGIATAWRLYRHASPPVGRLAAGVVASLIAFCCAAAVELTFLRQWVATLLLLQLAVVAQLAASETPSRYHGVVDELPRQSPHSSTAHRIRA